ncbi:MAG: AMP-binding protein, partial [Bacillota bacterium]
MSKQLWLKNYPVRWNLNYPEVSLYHYLCEKTSQCDQLIALVYDEESITFHKVHDNITRFAAARTDLGVKKGDRVALIMPNCPEYVYAYYACMKVG